MQQNLFENMPMSDAGQPVLLKTDVSSRFPLTRFIDDKESVLFIIAAMLEMWGYVYYDSDDDVDIAETEEFLNSHNIPYKKGQRNRMFLHYERPNGC